MTYAARVDEDALRMAAGNAAGFWARVARARGHETRRGDGWFAVLDDERGNVRVLTLAARGAEDFAALLQRPARVMVEDAFGSVSLAAQGYERRPMPVMLRRPARPAGEPRVPVRRIGADELHVAERLVVEEFPLALFQPYERGAALPEPLLTGVEVYLAELDGEPAGACVAVPEPEVVGVYWVTTGTAFRSRGVGRSLMHALLRRFDDRPMTLTASRMGRPLYESLGFEHLTQASWWTGVR
ncbi:GNAT family N-acetyltransferase [Dactylosporangium sp. CA-052675]|uniref:GNAT family N-acetyltransferase n=1 Tax=Dactylosporangium sp. CA-052675 TaxID=3239927 RepID=UPI003D938124